MKINDNIRDIIRATIYGQEGTERDNEIPFLFNELPEISISSGSGVSGTSRIKILDIGCCESPLVIYLNRIGFDCYGIDMRDCGCTDNDMRKKFIIGDVRNMDMFKDDMFDVVYAVSTIEHIGLGNTPYYTGQMEDLDGDIKVVREMMRVLKRSGKIIITIPFGHAVEQLRWARHYDPLRLGRILDEIKKIGYIDKVIYSQHCITKDNRYVWIESNEKSAYDRWSIWSSEHGAFIGSNVCISGYKK